MCLLCCCGCLNCYSLTSKELERYALILTIAAVLLPFFNLIFSDWDHLRNGSKIFYLITLILIAITLLIIIVIIFKRANKTLNQKKFLFANLAITCMVLDILALICISISESLTTYRLDYLKYPCSYYSSSYIYYRNLEHLSTKETIPNSYNLRKLSFYYTDKEKEESDLKCKTYSLPVNYNSKVVKDGEIILSYITHTLGEILLIILCIMWFNIYRRIKNNIENTYPSYNNQIVNNYPQPFYGQNVIIVRDAAMYQNQGQMIQPQNINNIQQGQQNLYNEKPVPGSSEQIMAHPLNNNYLGQ